MTTPHLITLGIDTSTRVSVGLARDGQPLASAHVDGMRHVEQVTPLVRRVAAEAGIALADIGRVAVGLGPGPFTGLRVGIVTAQTFAAALGVPLVGVCSLDVVALAHPQAGEFVAATDARRKELYWARYAPTGERLDGPHVTAPGELPDLPVVGPGASLYPLASAVADTGEGVDAAVLAARVDDLPDAGSEPLYLRRPDAEAPRQRKSALVGRHSGKFGRQA